MSRLTIPTSNRSAPESFRSEFVTYVSVAGGSATGESYMNGAESLIRTAVRAGVEICFANPGTTEMPLVLALDSVPGMRAILCLFEGVCTGAADGYGRMAGRPAMTLLHLGPGFANGIAYLHDARRARSPIVNVVGDHASWHLAADPPLASDIVSLARPVSDWLRKTRSAVELAGDMADAIAAASNQPGMIATLIVPHDCLLEPSNGDVGPRPSAHSTRVEDRRIDEVAELLKRASPAAIFLGGVALSERGLGAAARIRSATGCALICETFPTRMERGCGRPATERLPYFPEQGIAMLSRYRAILLAGAKAPVSFFGYPGIPSFLISPEQQSAVLASPEEDVVEALEALAECLGAPRTASEAKRQTALPRPTGKLNLENFAAAIASAQPENAVIMDEGNTSSFAYFAMSSGSPPFSFLTQPGGAIGLGLPCATGAALACPDRKAICLQADGSGMYTLQSLWTQAREGLDVTTIICSNRSYRVLRVELSRAGIKEPGAQTIGLTDLGRPAIDWVALSQGMGVPAVRVEYAEDLMKELERSLAEPGPHLIEALL